MSRLEDVLAHMRGHGLELTGEFARPGKVVVGDLLLSATCGANQVSIVRVLSPRFESAGEAIGVATIVPACPVCTPSEGCVHEHIISEGALVLVPMTAARKAKLARLERAIKHIDSMGGEAGWEGLGLESGAINAIALLADAARETLARPVRLIEGRYIPNTLEVKAYMHCGLCVNEWKADPNINTQMPPRDYARLEVGLTDLGIQVWCKRHEVNVLHIDFQGQQHPSNITRKGDGA